MAVVKAAVVHAFGQPEFSTFVDPAPTDEEHIVSMQAAALTQLVRAQAAGHHYSGGTPPFIPGVDGVGTLENGAQVYFAFPRSPFGAMAERVPVKSSYAIPVPHHLDPITAAAIANPGMSSWLALTKRAALEKGESVLVIGASGASGRLAVQIAKHLGAARVIAAARNGDAEDDIRRLGADAFITLTDNERDVVERFRVEIEHGIDVVLDYVWGPVAEAFFKAATLKRTGAAAPRIRFVNIGSMGGRSVSLSASAVRSSGLEVLGSGLGSSSVKGIIDATAAMFVAIRDARLKISVVSMPLADVEKAWQLKTSARVVLTM
jgi:NADPH:quinone reductase-like Zn-dependent oxidoreductase